METNQPKPTWLSLPPEQFLLMVSSELRHPANAILGYAEILSRPEMQDNHQQAIEWITKWAKGINSILDDVKDYLDNLDA